MRRKIDEPTAIQKSDGTPSSRYTAGQASSGTRAKPHKVDSENGKRVVVGELLEQLGNDVLHFGWINTTVAHDDECNQMSLDVWDIARELLDSGLVAIGTVEHAKDRKFLEFIAWSGSVDERLSRAKSLVYGEEASGGDSDFLWWMALIENVDRYENRP